MRRLLAALLILVLAACASQPARAPSDKAGKTPKTRSAKVYPRSASPAANEVVLYALGLLNIGYRFGGSNPDSGLDCSGMTAYIFREAVGINLPHSAAQQARLGLDVTRAELLPGDLVFFNTRNQPASHVGLYIGENRFVHAPSSNKKIQIALLSNPYFAQRFDGARRILN